MITHLYRFNGNSNDALGTANGTDTNITYSQANGIINQGAGFNSASPSKIRMSTAGFGFSSTGAFTISLCLKTATSGATQILIGDSWNTAGSNSGFILYITTGNKLKIYFSLAGVWYGTVDGVASTLTDGKWKHVVLVYNNKIVKFYINGALDVTGDMSATLGNGTLSTNTYGEIIGANFNTSNSTFTNYFTGAIDEVKIDNTAWNIAKIKNEYAKHKGFI
jgi:hypothetical protein